MIRVCKLSDEQIEKRAAVAHRSMGRNLIADEHHFLRAAVYDELLDRRRAAVTVDSIAHSMAYEYATSLIDGMCLLRMDEAESPETFFDLDSCSEQGYIEDEVDYLEQRGLLIHHPRHPRWVQFHNESEATVATPESPTHHSPKGTPPMTDAQQAARTLLQLSEAEPAERAAILAIPDNAARDVIRQLATAPRWDGDLNSKHGRDVLVQHGYAARWNGLNFLTQLGFSVVEALWGLEKFVK